MKARPPGGLCGISALRTQGAAAARAFCAVDASCVQGLFRHAESGFAPADSPGLVRYSCRMSEKQMLRRAFVASGQVQGVGFRPFVYRLAHEGGLTGTVGNTSDGVRMEVQGTQEQVERFGMRLQKELPPLARLTALRSEDLAAVPGETAFVIVASNGHAGHSVLVSPDVGVCADCLSDMADPEIPATTMRLPTAPIAGPAIPSPAPFLMTGPLRQ